MLTILPEYNKVAVFASAIPYARGGLIPFGGQTAPIAGVGETL